MAEPLECRLLLSASLLTDINTLSADSNPVQFTPVGSTLYFTCNDGYHGAELWKTDGTTAGTVLVKDIVPGPGSSYLTHLTNVNGTLFFSATDGSGGTELWKSDGTAAGTAVVANVASGTINAIDDVIVVDGNLYFTVSTGSINLWKSDGTPAGTSVVTSINWAVAAPAPVKTYLTNVNGTLYFVATDQIYGTRIWRSDGTSAGTVPILSAAASNLFSYNGDLYFTLGNQLYETDGTSRSAVPVRDAAGDVLRNPAYSTAMNGVLYLQADDGRDGAELWRTDGTAIGTWMVSDINPNGYEAASDPTYLTNVNGVLFFAAGEEADGTELWASDGTTAGTRMVADIAPGSASSNPTSLTDLDGRVFFYAASDYQGPALWQTDGTAAGTVLVSDLVPGRLFTTPSSLAVFDQELFFQANDGVHGIELWRSDGTTTGTVLVDDINTTTQSSLFQFQPSEGSVSAVVNGEMFFAADDVTNGTWLWKTDGTTAGTVPVDDLYPTDLTSYNGDVYFISYQRFYESDGTAAGTVPLQGLTGTPVPIQGSAMVPFNGALYFLAETTVSDNVNLWRTDGTAAGTFIVSNVNAWIPTATAGLTPSAAAGLTPCGNYLYFDAGAGSSSGLWRSDGTAVGTTIVKAWPSYGARTSPQNFCNVSGTLFFSGGSANDADEELWKSDGAAAGTVMVENTLLPNGEIATLENLVDLNGTLLFENFDAAHGGELWRSDGTAAGTYLVDDINPGPANSDIYDPTVFNGRLYFSAYANGENLWVTDGTASGTREIGSLPGGPNGNYGSSLTVINGALYFSGTVGSDGTMSVNLRLWRIDSAGNVTLADPTEPAAGWGGGPILGQVNNTIVFEGVDLAHGTEPWALPLPSVALTPASPNPSPSTLPLTFTATVTGGVPDGETVTRVDASNNTVTVATGTLSGGSATLAVPAGTLSVGTHNLIAAYAGDANFAASESAAYAQVVQATPPSLVGAPVINGDNPNGLFNAPGQPAPGVQRSNVEDIVYTFNEPVTIPDANAAFTLALAGQVTGTLPTTLYAAAVPGSNNTEWAVSLTGQPEGTLASIANGEYSITINPGFVFAAADGTTSMAAGTGRTDTFYRLYGDINGDRIVNNSDNFQFKRAQTTYNPAFDFNADGFVNNADNFQFKKDQSINVFSDGFVTTI